MVSEEEVKALHENIRELDAKHKSGSDYENKKTDTIVDIGMIFTCVTLSFATLGRLEGSIWDFVQFYGAGVLLWCYISRLVFRRIHNS